MIGRLIKIRRSLWTWYRKVHEDMLVWISWQKSQLVYRSPESF
jgi:hypothetical protein